jgi:hypothetical protein
VLDTPLAPNIVLSHDGFECTHAPHQANRGFWMLGAICATAGVVCWGILSGVDPIYLSVVVLLGGLTTAAAIWPMSYTISVHGTRLILDVRAGSWTRREVHEVDVLERVFLARRNDDYSLPYLAIVTSTHTLSFGEGLPESTLLWLVEAVTSAQHQHEHHAQDGSIYSFEKTFPEALKAMRDD